MMKETTQGLQEKEVWVSAFEAARCLGLSEMELLGRLENAAEVRGVHRRQGLTLVDWALVRPKWECWPPLVETNEIRERGRMWVNRRVAAKLVGCAEKDVEEGEKKGLLTPWDLGGPGYDLVDVRVFWYGWIGIQNFVCYETAAKLMGGELLEAASFSAVDNGERFGTDEESFLEKASLADWAAEVARSAFEMMDVELDRELLGEFVDPRLLSIEQHRVWWAGDGYKEGDVEEWRAIEAERSRETEERLGRLVMDEVSGVAR